MASGLEGLSVEGFRVQGFKTPQKGLKGVQAGKRVQEGSGGFRWVGGFWREREGSRFQDGSSI